MPPASAQIPSVRPISKLLCLRLNISLMQTCTKRIRPPPAAPWKARPMINASIVFAVAHTADDAKKTASASNMISLRPKMSESFAQIGPEAALPRRKAPPIHVYPAAEWRSWDIVGAAVATIVASKAATKRESCRFQLCVQLGLRFNIRKAR